MPKVGKKHYPYTHAGRRAAKEAAKKKGKKVQYTESTYERISKLMFEAKKARASNKEIDKKVADHLQKGIANIAGGKLGDADLIQKGIAKPSWGAGLGKKKSKKPKKEKASK
jgi:hypothetical protein